MLNNSCSASIFIGEESGGVIRHYGEPRCSSYPALGVVVKVYRGRAGGGGGQKKEACAFVTLMSGPLHLWEGGRMEAGEG